MALASTTSDRHRLQRSCRMRVALAAFVAMLALAFFMLRDTIGGPTPSGPSLAGDAGMAPGPPGAAAGTEAPGLADVLRSIKPAGAPGPAPSIPSAPRAP